jgi:hypothetical protein
MGLELICFEITQITPSLPGLSGQPIFLHPKTKWVARMKRAMTVVG